MTCPAGSSKMPLTASVFLDMKANSPFRQFHILTCPPGTTTRKRKRPRRRSRFP